MNALNYDTCVSGCCCNRGACCDRFTTASHCSSVRGMHMRSASQTPDTCHAGCSDNALKLTGCSNLATCTSTAGGEASVRPLHAPYLSSTCRRLGMDRTQIRHVSLDRRCTSWTRTVQKGLKPMLQPGSGLFGGVTQCLLLNS